MLISRNKLSRSLPEAVRDVSSAYNLVQKKVEDFGRSLIKIINSKGPSIDPGGTPVEIKRVSEATLISVCYSLIYPYLTYACTLWGNNYNAPLSQICLLYTSDAADE